MKEKTLFFKSVKCFREKNVSKCSMYQSKSWKRCFIRAKNIICLHCAASDRGRRHCRRVPRSDSVSRGWWCSSYSCCNSSPPADSWTENRRDWMVVLQMLQTRPLPPARGLKWEEIDWLKEKGRLTVAATRPLPPARGLKQNRLIDWLIEGKWSSYSCCNSSPPAGSWTETEEIDRLKENGRVTLLQTPPLSPVRGLKQKRLIIDRRNMVVLHMLQFDASAGS